MLDLFVNVFLTIPLVGAFAMFALGISVIYRASRVLNLAHGAMAMIPAYLAYSMVNGHSSPAIALITGIAAGSTLAYAIRQARVPMWIAGAAGCGLTAGATIVVMKSHVPMPFALVLAVAEGGTLGVGVEWLFVRRLRPQGPTAQTVGTVAAAGLLIALAAKLWGTTPVLAPHVFPNGQLRIGGAAVRFGDIGLFVVGILVSAGLFAFFKFTEFGLAMRGAAQNRRAASMMGIDPDRAASAAWALGGSLAALAGVLLAAVTNLDPYNLSLQVLPAFVAALIGGLENLLGALAGAGIAGLAFGLVPTLAKIPVIDVVLKRGGAPQLILTILALGVLAIRGRKLSVADGDSGLVGGRPLRTSPARVAGPGRIGMMSLLLVIIPWVVPFSILGDFLLAVELAMVALSLVVLTGWVGQISLAQASFVGIGALVPALAARGLGWGFPATAILGAVVGAGAAALLGVVALRVRGLYLAIATLIFAWMADQFLFRSPWFGASGGTSGIPNQRIGSEGSFISLDLTSRRVLYFIFVAILIAVIAALANLRETKTGRAFFAIRGSEVAAASLGIDVVRTKLIAFAISGTLAGIAGSLFLTDHRTVVPADFLFTVSLQYLAIVVVGGLSSLGGAVASGLVFAALTEVFYRVRFLAGWLEVVSAGLLGVVLLVYPGGLAAIPASVQSLLERYRPHVDAIKRAARRVAEVPTSARERALPMTRRFRSLIAPAAAGMRAPLASRLSRMRMTRNSSSMNPKAWSLPELDGQDWYATATAHRASTNGTHPIESVELTFGDEPAHPKPGALTLGDQERPSLLEDRSARTPLLEAIGIVVRFGGLTAVKGASLTVCDGEIVGLIGPNGAGKTTFFNAVLGLNEPAEGSVHLHGVDVSASPPHIRARLGLTRTFQVIQLFNDLSVFDNLLVATHLHNSSGLLSHLIASDKTVTAEQGARARVREILHLLGLDEVADEPVKGLPFGILRLVELGRSLVTGARLMMLDEPVSGLNEAETDRFIEVVRGVRALGVSVLLIEHDVRAVTGVSDYMYVLEQGALIAEGTPAEVQRDPKVIAAYLGGVVEETESVIS